MQLYLISIFPLRQKCILQGHLLFEQPYGMYFFDFVPLVSTQCKIILKNNGVFLSLHTKILREAKEKEHQTI